MVRGNIVSMHAHLFLIFAQKLRCQMKTHLRGTDRVLVAYTKWINQIFLLVSLLFAWVGVECLKESECCVECCALSSTFTGCGRRGAYCWEAQRWRRWHSLRGSTFVPSRPWCLEDTTHKVGVYLESRNHTRYSHTYMWDILHSNTTSTASLQNSAWLAFSGCSIYVLCFIKRLQ